MHGGGIGGGIMALAFGAGSAAAIDFDDPDAGPLRLVVEMVSGEAIGAAVGGGTGRRALVGKRREPIGADRRCGRRVAARLVRRRSAAS